MIKTTAIRTVNNDDFSVIWDTGRRCNYDCTYCEATRHNNYSAHKTLEEFKKSFDFIRKWSSLYNAKRKVPTGVNINFTGGEPTANPNFWELIEYIKQQEPNYNLGLTTNGAWSKKFSSKIIKNIGGVTVSYHAEADASLKSNVIDNILLLAEAGKLVQVNVMLHVDHWDETLGVYNMLKAKGIRANPRPIGDGNVVRKGWFIDSDGTNRRSSHEYSEEQQQWFFNEMGITEKPASPAEGNQFGRACCGSRCLEGKVDNQWQPIKFIDTQFENWYCMVDWFFLYIDQETGSIYHHQTCKALLDKQQGMIGTLDQTDKLLADLKHRLSQPEIRSIICPNPRCGCGMCVPKAQSIEEFNELKRNILVTT
jgi:sulfatase maturation enzyme AslB (radical SAM superfamily)